MRYRIRKKFLLSVLFLMPVMIYFAMPHRSKQKCPQPNKNSSTTWTRNFVRPMTEQRKPQKFDLVINSYMNSGSRFTGQLFGFRTGAFYIYEPLWGFNTWDYFRAENLVCNTLDLPIGCEKLTAAEVNKRPGKVPLLEQVAKNVSIVSMMLDVLNDMYDCKFLRLEKLFTKDSVELAGPDWECYNDCLRSMNYTKIPCLRKQEQRCKKSSHIVTKVLRLTTGCYEKLLEKRRDLKLIHLFRNPFAIINSRMETVSYPIHDYNINAKTLCQKMLLDYQEGVKLIAKFPGRVKFVFYEDIKSNVPEKMKKLYEYIGMDTDMAELVELNSVSMNEGLTLIGHTMRMRFADNARWWRKHISFRTYRAIKDKCEEIVTIFNLTDFKDRQELVDLSVPEMDLPVEFRI